MNKISSLDASTRKRVLSLQKQLNGCGLRIAKERDRIRDLLDEYETIKENCDEAIDDIERAVDKLSELL